MSIIYYELTEISPGGVIVPGYIALYIYQPEKIIITIGLSLITLLIVKALSNYMILYGRRSFGLMIIVSFMIKLLFGIIVSRLPDWSIVTTSSIGYVIPAIIAKDIERQGIVKTISSMILVACIVKLIDIIAVSGVGI